MRIAIFNTSTGWGGLELNVRKLVREFKKRGIESSYILRANSRLEKEMVQEDTDIITLSSPRKYFNFKDARRLAKELAKKKISVLFVPFRPDLDLAAWVKIYSKGKIRIIHQQHMQIGISKKGLLQRFRYNTIDKWIAPIEWLKQETIEKTTVPAEKIVVLPIGFDGRKFTKSNLTKAAAREKLNLSPDAFIIGLIGRIDKKKGQRFLVESLLELKKWKANTKILLFGSPTINDASMDEYMKDIHQYIEMNNLNKEVYFRPFSDEIQQFYSSIDVFVMASESETYGMVTLEAMASQVPVLGTNAGGTTELLDFGKRGELYEYNDRESFMVSLPRLLKRIENKELNLKLIQSSIVEGFATEIEVDGLIEVFNNLK